MFELSMWNNYGKWDIKITTIKSNEGMKRHEDFAIKSYLFSHNQE